MGSLFGKQKLLIDYTIPVNDPVQNKRFPSNEISTTKYTYYNFLFKNLFEQFRRYQNFYFLLVCIPTLIPGIAPISPASAIIPFLLILTVAACKEAYEDFMRYLQDREFNNRKYEAWRDGLWVNVTSESLMAGSLVVIKDNEEVPCDVVIISTTHPEGKVYYDTANLDGETYLKQGVALPETVGMTRTEIQAMSAILTAEQPHKTLYEFTGNLNLSRSGELLDNPLTNAKGELMPLGKDQFLMRGVRVRNTRETVGIVCYTGPNTKMALNQVKTPSKFSQTEKSINVVTVGVFCLKMIFVVSATAAYGVQSSNNMPWYNPFSNLSLDTFRVFASYFVLLAFFIPISLFVNLEVIKLAQAYFMMSDDGMKLDGKKMSVRNSNLNDELSRVSYIFSDKTGTLTQNKMVFDSVSINGTNYVNAGKGELAKKVGKDLIVTDFMLNLATNHEVLPEKKSGEIMPHYAAPSPDEIAIIKGAFLNGVKLLSRDSKGVEVQILDSEPEHYEVLDILPFSNVRKRSSVIVRMPSGRIVLYCKGADSAIFPRCTGIIDNSNPIFKITKRHMTTYSVRGLRTLILAKRELSVGEFNQFHQAFREAQGNVIDKKSLMDGLMERIEVGLELQGCTAIEDKLQDRVPWAVNLCIRAGIKVWMITGDKQETAENIGKSCNLIQEDTTIIRITQAGSMSEARDMVETCRRVIYSEKKVSLVVDSQSLNFLLTELRNEFLEIGRVCASVIVCRAEPLQKAQVVALMKKGTGEITLAIGDGANDVSMIQEAHIGVGIWGEEGSQAARNSDFSLHQFKHLARLVIIHGRYNMLRTALMVEFSFYKNLAMFIVQYWFAFYCNFSSNSFYDDWVMAAFNTILLSAPPLSLAFFEKDLQESAIIHHPESYIELRNGLYFTRKTFARWMMSALWNSLVFWFSIYLIPSSSMRGNGWGYGKIEASTVIAIAAITSIIIKAALVTRYWVWVSFVAYIGSFAAIFFVFSIEASFVSIFPNFYGTMTYIMGSPYFYFHLPCVILLCVVPELIIELIQVTFFPKNWQILREATVDHRFYDDAKQQQLQEFSEFIDISINAEVGPLDIRNIDASTNEDDGTEMKEIEI